MFRLRATQLLCSAMIVDEITTPRLVLRRFVLQDAADLFAMDTDPNVRRFVEDGQPVTLDAAIASIESWNQLSEPDTMFGFWAVIERSTGNFVGWVHLLVSNGRLPDEPELGYRFVSSSWNKGFATEGSVALIDRAFQSTAIRRVVAETMAVNSASRRVMEKVGMCLVRTFTTTWPVHILGDEHGDVEYAITVEQWAQRPTAVDSTHELSTVDRPLHETGARDPYESLLWP